MVEDVFYRDKVVRASERAEWMVSAGPSAKRISARLGAGMEPIVDDPAVRVMNISGVNGTVWNIACLELPAKLFGLERFKSGDAIDFASTFFTHCRAYRVDWKGRFNLLRK